MRVDIVRGRSQEVTRGVGAKGFSFVEVILILAVVAVVASIAMPYLSSMNRSSRIVRDESSVVAINSAISVYLANGGQLKGERDPSVVIERLKSKMKSEQATTFVGVTGHTLDSGVFLREAEAGEQGIWWNSETLRFETSVNTQETRYVIYSDAKLASNAVSSVDREKGLVTYGKSGWVWDYKDASPEKKSGVTSVPTRQAPSSSIPGSSAPASNQDPAAVDDVFSVEIGGSISGNVLSNDSDPNGDSLTLVGNTNPSHGAFTIAGSGNFHYTPGPGYRGGDAFSYIVSDGVGGQSSASVALSVSERNNAPEANDDRIDLTGWVGDTWNVFRFGERNGMTGETISLNPGFTGGESVHVDVMNNDSDPDGDELVITAVNFTNSDMLFSPAVSGDQVELLSRFATPSFSWKVSKLPPGYRRGEVNGRGGRVVEEITYTVSDGRGLSDDATIYVMLTLETIYSPIAFDLNGDRRISRISKGVSIDLTGDSLPEAICEWFGPEDGILIDTRNVGPIGGNDLFGDMGGKYTDGFQKLSGCDASGDGVISGRELEGMGLWQDLNSNALAESGEVKMLSEYGITEISTSHNQLVGEARTSSGKLLYIEDVWFRSSE